MKTVESIKKLLREQLEGYKALMELLKRERECLVDLNQKGVEELSKEKDTLTLKLRLLEEERVRLTRKIADALANGENIYSTGGAATASSSGAATASSSGAATASNSGTTTASNSGTATASIKTATPMVGELTLRKLGELTGDGEFADIRTKLRSLTQGIEELNDFNKLIIERSLNYIKRSSVFLQAFGVGSGVQSKGIYLAKEA
jgi:flagellar biosynthesis/type III secretory pathway chaperone